MEATSDPSLDEGGRTSFIHELICRFEEEVGSFQIDSVIEEAVFTVYVDGEVFRDMTCSPWDVEELVVGNLFTSGRVDAIEQIDSVEVDAEAAEVRVVLSEDGGSEGRASGAVVDRVLCPQVDARAEVAPMLTAREVSARIGFLEGNSDLFHRTGGVHSAVMVDARGDLVAWFEDIGRHNALDKLIGWCVLNKVDASDKILLFSGRVPREIIARAIRAGFPIVISPGAPTNLSIRLACDHGVTLIGFAKDGKFNVYTHSARIR